MPLAPNPIRVGRALSDDDDGVCAVAERDIDRDRILVRNGAVPVWSIVTISFPPVPVDPDRRDRVRVEPRTSRVQRRHDDAARIRGAVQESATDSFFTRSIVIAVLSEHVAA
jgi:hypothetical protein